MNFEFLVNTIQDTHNNLQQSAVKAVNIHLTLRNWLVGFYIVEYEQKGEDRAKYGSQLLNNLANSIKIKGLTSPELSRCRQFYQIYSSILEVITQELHSNLPVTILGMASQELGRLLSSTDAFMPLTQKNQKEEYLIKLFVSTSYSHFIELIKIEDNVKRSFYELLILKTQPSVTELRRQINTLTFERLGLSANQELAFEQIQQKITPVQSSDAVKSHYFFEFLNIKQPHLIEESDLEQALIDHLQDFLLELGHGFCFEARQKRILIDDEYYFVDLVFYNRILKCHVLVELKADSFKHEHISQLNTYVAYYKAEVKQKDDNPPIGILLCTEKGKKLVEYALAGMDEQLFVSKYLVELPSKEQLSEFIEKEVGKM